MQTLFEVAKTLPHVVKVDYLHPGALKGMYIETDVLKLSTAEKVLDDLLTVFGDRAEQYHFGLKTQQALFPNSTGSFYCIYVESKEEYNNRK